MKRGKQVFRALELLAFLLVVTALTICLAMQFRTIYYGGGKPAALEEKESEASQAWALLQPETMYLTQGTGAENGYGRLTRDDKDYEELFTRCMLLLRRCLQEGEAAQAQAENFPWERSGCVFVYGLTLNQEFLQVAAEEEKLEESISGEEIWIFPSTAFGEPVQVWIADWTGESFCKFEWAVHYEEENQTVLRLLREKLKSVKKEWRCLQECFPGIFSGNGFVLRSGKSMGVETYFLRIPFLDEEGELIQEETVSFAASLFEHPDTMQCLQQTEKQVLYTNEAVTLTVHQTGEVDYTEAWSDSGRTTDISQDYLAAQTFLEEKIRPCLPEEIGIRLCGYSCEEASRCFRFEYCWDPMKICMESWLPAGLTAPAEITVENGQVRCARFLPLAKEAGGSIFQVLETPWTSAVIPVSGNLKKRVPEPCLQAGEGGSLWLVWQDKKSSDRMGEAS